MNNLHLAAKCVLLFAESSVITILINKNSIVFVVFEVF